MTRFALRTLALGFTVAAHVGASDSDATVLVQRYGHISAPIQVRGGYALDKFNPGEEVEGKGKGNQWVASVVTAVKGGNTYDIHVVDEFPGYDLPNVPANLLRRPLGRGQSDWLVDNSRLQHHGHGVLYRLSKNDTNRSSDYAPWGSLVIGRDEGDGWLKVSSGYLPITVHGSQVLRAVERTGDVSPMNWQFKHAKQVAEEQRAAKAAQAATTTPPVVTFERWEEAEYRTHQGKWYKAQVVDVLPKNLYNLVLQTDNGPYPVKNAQGARMRKGAFPPHQPQPNESPMCQRDGCITVTARTEEGEDLEMHVSRRMKVDMLIKMACNKAGLEADACGKATFTFKDHALTSDQHIVDTGLADGSVVLMTKK